MRKTKLCIFDLDGTIVDSLEAIAFTCDTALKAYGFQGHTLEAYKYFVGDAMGKLVERALIASGDTMAQGMPSHYEVVLQKYKDMFPETCTHCVKAYKGMPETLQYLKDQGIYLAVFSNKSHAQAIQVTEAVYGKDLFDLILGESPQFPRKPSPEGVLHILKQFACEKDQSIYVGDTDTDMYTGTKAGLFTAGVLWGFRKREELEASGAHVLLERPWDLTQYL